MNDPKLVTLIERLTAVLEENHILYGVTGSVASGFHGEPVSSIDVVIVTHMSPEQAARVAADLQGTFYADEQMLRRAATERGMANVMDFRSGLKGDLSVLKDEPYSRQVLKRVVRAVTPAIPRGFWVVSAEDVILMKLHWRKDSRSQKQWQNALAVLKIKGHTLDWNYLRHWAGELGVEEDLDHLIREAGL